ncbi:MAG: hypothetical protein O7D30_12295 [Rickettsia endosymbiont of Ixodes persulcatus]|nr:hypothetical protein [Rickettsia endosymbiont of Ixodes persulcatus]
MKLTRVVAVDLPETKMHNNNQSINKSIIVYNSFQEQPRGFGAGTLQTTN